jgi:hypothetical protein
MKIKVFDVSGYNLIDSGICFPKNLEMCDEEELVGLLANGEHYIYWFQPKTSKSVCDQVPALRFGSSYYTINIKMMKAVWRHVRLKRGFLNRERCLTGGYKLRIPQPLYLEKRRTQTRFQVHNSKVKKRTVFFGVFCCFFVVF